MKFKKIAYSLPIKIVAIFLVTVIFLGTAAMGINILAMYHMDAYFKSDAEIKKEIAENYLYGQSYAVADWAHYPSAYSDMYLEKQNYYYIVQDTDENVLYSNYSGQKYLYSTTRPVALEIWDDSGSSYTVYEYIVTLYLKTELPKADELFTTFYLFDIGYSLKDASIVLCITGTILFLALFIFLCCVVGHRSEHRAIIPNFVDRIPFDIYTAVHFFIFYIILHWFDTVYFEGLEMIIAVSAACLVGFLLLLGYALSIATRIKLRTLISNTLIFMIISYLSKIALKVIAVVFHISRNISIVWKTCFAIAILAVLNIFATIASDCWEMFIFLLIEGLILVPCVILISISLRHLQKGGQKIAAGEIEHHVDTRYMFGAFKMHGENLNSINAAISKAVEKQTKSERFKTELITNVSHDIKTPLTSIINYVDLIKKEDPQDETIKEYLDVLDRQSNRLKKLIEDLVEASKAATGNMAVNMVPCDVGIMLAQVSGEYEEKLRNSKLELILRQPEESVRIMADGQHLWRVFDNLLNNICKYTQPSTRVYLTLETIGEQAKITFRNISKYELNIYGDELLERFVRGDSSRNTEGHGLGLSIAKSLIDLQHGQMDLIIDGDLFKVVLTFPLMD